VYRGCGLPSVGVRASEDYAPGIFFFETLHAYLYILVLFGVVWDGAKKYSHSSIFIGAAEIVVTLSCICVKLALTFYIVGRFQDSAPDLGCKLP